MWQDELGKALGLLQILEAVRPQLAQCDPFGQGLLDQVARRLGEEHLPTVA
jgi:hypothetical protein